MATRIIYTDEDDVQFLRDRYDVQEVIDLGPENAVVVETDDALYDIYTSDELINSVDADFEFTIDVVDAMDDDRLGTVQDVKELHEATDGLSGEGQTVAAMDSGVDTTHPYFDDVNIKKVNFTDSNQVDTVGHGTAVLGQVHQMAPDADLVMLRVFGDKGRTSLRTIYRAYSWVINHAGDVDVLNMSLGSSNTSQKLNENHNRVEEKGVTTVVSSGNSGGPSGSPATASKAYSVGACDDEGNMANFSSYNPNGPKNPEVTALGKNNKLAKSKNATMGQKLGGRFVKASGTSFSAPEVAGLVASLRSHNVEKPRKALSQTAKDITGTPRDGHGLVKYASAKEGDEKDGVAADVWGFAGQDSIFIHGDYLSDGDYTVTKTTDEEGNTILEFEPAE